MCPLVYNRCMYSSKIRPAIKKYLADRPDEAVFLRFEFKGCGKTRSGVDKALRVMVRDGELIRVGYGTYVRAEQRTSVITGEMIKSPVVGPSVWAPQVLRKLGITVRPNSALRAYNEGKTTQVPAWIAFDVGTSRVKRKYRIGNKEIYYETSKQTAS